MKKSKFTKVIFFIVALVVVFSTVTLNSSGASTYLTVTSSHDCPKALCFKDLMVSGPYGDPNETVDSSIPHYGGKTYYDIYRDRNDVSDHYLDYHMFLIYCPKFDNSDSSLLRHTMTLMFGKHGYTTMSYSQYNEYNHYANKKCDHSVGHNDSKYIALTQELCGENAMLDNATLDSFADEFLTPNGCGKEASFLETHTWSYGSWYNSGSYHTRSKTCIYCGYSTTESDNHSTTTSEWISSSDAEHKRNTACSTCGYSAEEKQAHNFAYGEWSENGNGTCSRTKTCSACGYIGEENKAHDYEYTDWTRVNNDPKCNDSHRRTKICKNCSYSEYEYEKHDDYYYWVEDAWEQFSDDMCYRSKICSVCNTNVSVYTKHQYASTIVSISPEQHDIIKTCTLCGQSTTSTADHYFIGEEYGQYSDSQHTVTKHCNRCDEIQTLYEGHIDSNSDCYCDDCGYLMTMFSVTVPTTMNFTMSKTGEIYSADNVKIINNSTAAVTVKQMNINAQNGWSIVPYDTNIAFQKVDSKIIGLKLNDVETVGNGKTETLIPSAWNIEKGASLPLSYDAVVSATSTPITDERVLNVVFVVDWIQ